MSASAVQLAKAGPVSKGTRAFARFEWMLALRYLRSRRSRFLPSVIAAISFLAIMVAVTTLIVVMSVMNGFHLELMNKIIGVNGHLFLQASGRPLENYDAVIGRLAKVPGIRFALPMVEGAAGVSSRVQQTGALVRGVRERDLKMLPGIGANVKQGTLDGFDSSEGVAIGQRMADNLGVRIGDSISILTARGEATPFGMAPRIKAYPVVAIFQIGVSEFDNIFVYMPLQEAQAYFSREGQATVIEAFADDPDSMDDIRARIDAALEEPLLMVDWRQRNQTFFEALKVERTVMFFILTLIVLVASLSIISGLTMLVKDKGRAIAILRTMGATSGAIMRVFLLTGISIGIAGTGAGFLFGVLLARNLEPIRVFINRMFNLNVFDPTYYFLSQLPSSIRLADVLSVVLLSLTLSILATIYPSWRAARLDPVDALRYE